jgi:hypothetical protein
MRTLLRRTALAATVVGLAVVGLTTTEVGAGGMDALYPVRDRYEPGDTATMVGHTVRSTPNAEYHDRDTLDWSDTGPFHGYLRVDPVAVQRDGTSGNYPGIHPTDIDLGEPTVAATEHRDLAEYFAVRVSLTFLLPADLQPGGYTVFIADQTGARTLGYIGESPIYVGIDPPQPILRVWPLDDPAITDLASNALLYDDDGVGTLTAAQVRAGDVPASSTAPPTTDRPRQQATDDLVATTPPDAGPDVGGTLPWLVGFAVLVVLWCVAWRVSHREGQPPRKRVTDAAAPRGDDRSGLRSDGPLRVRL